MAISPALRGIALILAPLDEVSKPFKTSNNGGLQETKKPSVFYLTGQVVAAYHKVRLTPPVVGSYRQDFGGPRRAGFRKAQLASACLPKPRRRQSLFEQPGKDDLFNSLLKTHRDNPVQKVTGQADLEFKYQFESLWIDVLF